MKMQTAAVEQIDFNGLRRDLQTLMEEVDRRLASEFDAFSPATDGTKGNLDMRKVEEAFNICGGYQ